MQEIAGQLCVTYEELLSSGISEANIKIMRHRGNIRQVQRACRTRQALFAIDSLPEKYRNQIAETSQDSNDTVEHDFINSITPNAEAIQYYASYILPDGRHIPEYHQTIYANNCAILDACLAFLSHHDSHRARQSNIRMPRSKIWQRMAEHLPACNDKWPHTLPANPRVLQRKAKEYTTEGFRAIISAKWANRNAAKVLAEQQHALLIQLIAHHNNLDNQFIAETYNKVARLQQWPEISASTVANHRQRTVLETGISRRGLSNFRNEHAMQVRRSRPTAPFLYWTLDGWDCELLYKQTTTDRRGHTTTTYHNRLTLEVVLDPSCDYPIGYAIGTHETPELIRQALLDALLHTQQLTGVMLRTNQLQCDHYALKAMTPLYAAIADKVTPARVKNAKAKVIEPYFGYLNKTYCRCCNNWSGFGITTDPKKQPNAEALNALRHTFPDEQELRQQIDSIILTERMKKKDDFLNKLQQLPPERRLPMQRETFLLHFGQTTGYRNAIEGPGLRPRILGQRREYDSFDITFRQHADQRWQIHYDPSDLSTILAVNEDRSLQYLLEAKHTQPMALAERSEGDAQQLARINEFNRSLEQHVSEQMQIAYKHTEQLLSASPETDNILGRLLIVNSDGQHKLPKAQQRLEAAATHPDRQDTDNANPDNPYDIFW